MSAFRYLDPEAREEAVAETAALCWKDYVSCMRKRKRFTPGNLAYYAMLHVRSGNLFNGRLSTDAMGERARLLGRAAVESIYVTSPADHRAKNDSWWELSDALIDRRTWETPSEAARIRVDYGAFLNGEGLTEREREVFQMLAEGYRPSEIARALSVWESQVTYLKRGLGQKLERFYGDDLRPARQTSP
jgi:ATP/maltotriose-dependent transcriptional regulator MalT